MEQDLAVVSSVSANDSHFSPSIRVMGRLAKVFLDYSYVKKTHLHLISRLRWNYLEKYLETFQAKGYVIYKIDSESRGIYHVTESGRETFSRFLDFLECINCKTA